MMITRIILTLVVLLISPLTLADGISGFWKHAGESVWIEIRLKEGKGTLVRNDEFPERVGFEILKSLKTEGLEQGLWRGLVYAERLGEYKDVEISLPQPDRMVFKVKVGFMSRTVEWLRVEEAPRAP